MERRHAYQCPGAYAASEMAWWAFLLTDNKQVIESKTALCSHLHLADISVCSLWSISISTCIMTGSIYTISC